MHLGAEFSAKSTAAVAISAERRECEMRIPVSLVGGRVVKFYSRTVEMLEIYAEIDFFIFTVKHWTGGNFCESSGGGFERLRRRTRSTGLASGSRGVTPLPHAAS